MAVLGSYLILAQAAGMQLFLWINYLKIIRKPLNARYFVSECFIAFNLKTSIKPYIFT